MGSHHKDQPKHKDIDTFYLTKCLTSLGLATAAPRGTGQDRQHGLHCRTEYITVWDTEYEERETQECITKWVPECKTVTKRKCEPTTRNVCDKVYEKKCTTVWKNVCEEEYRTEYVTVTETECTTKNSKDCKYTWEGKGDNMKWVIIPGSCEIQPHDKCKDVTKKECENEHKKSPVRVSKRIAKKVCDSDDGYADPLSIPDYDEYEYDVEVIEAKSGRQRRKNKKDRKDSEEDSSEEDKSDEE